MLRLNCSDSLQNRFQRKFYFYSCTKKYSTPQLELNVEGPNFNINIYNKSY